MPITKWGKDGIVYRMETAWLKKHFDAIKENSDLGCMVDNEGKVIYFIYGVSYDPRIAGLEKMGVWA